MKKDLLKLLDLSKEDILKILNTADQLKFSQKHGIAHDKLKGQDSGHDLREKFHPHPRLL